MNINTLWGNVNFKSNKKIDNNVDILIIGGGITGITLSYYLKDINKKVMLIDKSNMASGITSKTTAKITYLQGDIYQKLENTFNKEVAHEYLESQKDATFEIKKIIKTNKIHCDFKKTKSIIFTLKEENKKKINKENRLLKSFGIKTFKVKDDRIKKGIGVNDTYEFNPIKYLEGLLNIIKDKIIICEDVCATKVVKDKDKYIVTTNKGNIIAKNVIFTCHYPFFIKPLFLPLKAYVKREYVNASKIANVEDFNAISIDNDLNSIRFYKDYIIYGSNKNKLTDKIDYEKNYYKSIDDFYYYFNKKSDYTWMNQDIVSNDNLPFIGRIDNNLYISTSYGAWGMTNGVIGAKIISDLIINNKSKYEKLFNPKRLNFTLIYKMFPLIFTYIKVYIKSIFKKNNPSFIKIDGIMYGVYIDEFNVKHRIKLICPHLKCNLVFNEIEKTWDCPCHGSRFDLDGNLLEGPAKNNLEETNFN